MAAICLQFRLVARPVVNYYVPAALVATTHKSSYQEATYFFKIQEYCLTHMSRCPTSSIELNHDRDRVQTENVCLGI